MVDTKDLKSFGLYRLCGFESHFLYFKWLILRKVPAIIVKWSEIVDEGKKEGGD